MNLSYETFLQEFEQLIGDEWTCLFDMYHQKLNLKNRNIATKKFKTIIEGVFKLSQEKGFQAMTMRDLSHETGVSMGGLYKYFANKDQIAEMVHSAMIHMAETCLKIKEYRHQDPVFELNELLARHVFLSERLKKWFYFVFMECRSLDRDLIEDIIATEQFMEMAILERILDANSQKLSQCTNPDFVASMLKVMLQEWYLKSWKYIEKDINADQYVANLLLSVYQMIQVK
jgi:AcrR family transcriptional regulator